MTLKKHLFTPKIEEIVAEYFPDNTKEIISNSLLINYLNEKTKSASRGSKSRSSFANVYAIYVLVEDYIDNKFHQNNRYSKYDGASYSNLLVRQRQLPFGGSLQNHGLNNRMNAEFAKFFPTSDIIPILRNLETKKYWFNENLLNIEITGKIYNIALCVKKLIDEYIVTKQSAFTDFMATIEAIRHIEGEDPQHIKDFILGLLKPNVDARTFEIVSYSILKYYYNDITIYWGYELDDLKTDKLILYKTGRTNANDGGIDFVMKPLGRFFQVTETLDFKKYFLDIDKIQKFPITFVIKTLQTIEEIKEQIKTNATKTYKIDAIVDKYMSCIEEIININFLKNALDKVFEAGNINHVLDEIVLQSKLEFNVEDDDKYDGDDEDELDDTVFGGAGGEQTILF